MDHKLEDAALIPKLWLQAYVRSRTCAERTGSSLVIMNCERNKGVDDLLHQLWAVRCQHVELRVQRTLEVLQRLVRLLQPLSQPNEFRYIMTCGLFHGLDARPV